MHQIVDNLKLTPEQIRDGVTPPVLTHQVLPIIPWSVREWHQSLEKSVVAEGVIDELGNVRETHVIQSAGSDLDDAAVTAVAQYKFKPAKYKGHPVAVKTDIHVAFHISD
jgi:TonB family protein